MSLITEEQVELQGIEWFKELGYQYKDGYEIAPEGVNPERDDFRQVILEERFKSAIIKINPDIPKQTIQNSIPQILNPNIPGLLNCNREMHKWITKGLKVTFMEDNQDIGRQLKLIDFENIDNNWKYLAEVLKLIPTNLLNTAYRWVSRNRAKVSVKKVSSCPIVPSYYQKRFIL